jgi:hypothetical protein
MKKLIICVVCSLFTVIGFGQTAPQQPSKFDPRRLEYGGNFGLSFGTTSTVWGSGNSTSIIIAPQVGYVIDPHFSAGIGVNYSYYHYSIDSYGTESLNYMGLNVYGRAKPFNPVVLQLQPEIYRVWGNSFGSPVSKIVPALLAGGGIIIPVGNNRGGILLMLYYDLAQNSYSPYGNRVFFSVGYTVSL